MQKNTRKFPKIIIVLLLIVAAIVGFALFSKTKDEKTVEEKYENVVTYENEDLSAALDELDAAEDEKLKTVTSDIEGMSLYDKKVAGLVLVDGSDTDLDGLSDKDEIEKYGTDPLLTSTSGDLYPDGQKVAEGMDLHKFYEDSEITFYYNGLDFPEEVTLVPAKASDWMASIVSKLANETEYRRYYITGFAGKAVEIDLTPICEEKGVKAKNIDCVVEYLGLDGNPEVNVTVNDNVMRIEYDFEKYNGCNIKLVRKKGFFEKQSENLFGDTVIDDITETVSDAVATADSKEPVGLVCFPMPGWIDLFSISDCTCRIYYNNTGSEELNAQTINALKKWAGETVNSKVKVEYKLVESSYAEIKRKYEFREKIFDGFFNLKHMDFFHNAFYAYGSLNDYNEQFLIKENIIATGMADFDAVEDTLPFANFSTPASVGGSCMGISTLIAKVYNEGGVEASGSSAHSNISWSNLDEDTENETLFNEGLGDYKYASWATDHSSKKIVNSNLSDGEKEFVNIIAAYFTDGNAEVVEKCPKVTDDKYRGYSLNPLLEVCENAFNGDKDKILTLSMEYRNTPTDRRHGHTVNVYGYEDNTANGGDLILYIYDNNFPGSASDGAKVVLTPRKSGGHALDYTYKSDNKEGYGYSSVGAYEYMLVIADENFNVLYGTEDDLFPAPHGLTDEQLREFEAEKAREEYEKKSWMEKLYITLTED